jgi:hypothetical protein
MGTSTEVVAYDTALFPKLLDQDPAEVSKRFARRFQQAESLDDLFNVLEGNTSKDLVGHTVEITGVAWAPYESDRGIIPLAVCEAVDQHSGEVIEFATTSEMLTLFIRRAEIIGAIPFTARVAGKKTRSGQTALNFERV